MASLETDVKNRIPSQTLIELTNATTTATSIDDDILTNAATDVKADFETYAGIEYDSTEAQHVSRAVEGVALKLLVYKFESKSFERYQAWQEDLHKRLRLVTGQDRVTPKSSSRLTPRTEAPGGTVVRPWFDGEDTGDIVPHRRGRRGGGFPGQGS